MHFGYTQCKQKGQIPVLILVGMLIIALVVGGAYYLGRQTYQQPTPVPVVSQPPQPISTPDSTANWKTYSSQLMGFSIRHPSDWQVIYDEPDHVYLGYENSPPKFFVELHPNPKELSLEEYKDTLNKADYTFSSIKIGDLEGIKVVSPIFPYVILQMPNNNTILLLGGKSTEFDQILSTFKFMN